MLGSLPNQPSYREKQGAVRLGHVPMSAWPSTHVLSVPMSPHVGWLTNRQDDKCCCSFAQAYNAFTEDQKRASRRHVADIVHAPIDTLEKVGGGGVRCTLAEVF